MNRNVTEYYKLNRLEGWLAKYCDKGPLKGFRRRFITFNPSTLKLEEFKQSTDKIPLDSIDIQRSVLTINCQDELPSIYETTSHQAPPVQSTNSFRIICGEKVWLMEADSTQSCIDWLQKLQKLRKRLNDKNEDFDMLNELDDSECLIGKFMLSSQFEACWIVKLSLFYVCGVLKLC